ncbi:Protein SSUH2 -like protein [Halotydeus destructor]|nr:Protein SSUH2 -like protein [Halotydeus destructor]
MAETAPSDSKLDEAKEDTATGPTAPVAQYDEDLPPPYYFSIQQPEPCDVAYAETTEHFEIPVTTTTEDQVRTALREFADKKMFFTEKRLADTVIKDIVDRNVFLYQLVTMYEKRSTVDAAVPWHGEQVDGPQNGAAPGPWDIPVLPTEPFKSAEFRTPVPFTAYIRPCFKCSGMGRVECWSCSGTGEEGSFDDRKDCFSCDGSGKTKCRICQGQCQLKHYVELVVNFISRTLESVDISTDLSEEKAKSADGHLVVDHRAQRVSKLTNFPSVVIRKTSPLLIDMSLSQFPLERVVEQRQTVKVVPVAKVTYGYGIKSGSFRLYGKERRVDFKDYPSACDLL